MDKYKIEKAVKRICYLSKFKSYLSEMGMLENQEYFYREFVNEAREIVTAAGDDIVGTPTPAGIKVYPSGKREFVCTKLSYRDPNATAHTD
ncbi:MAG: hypothetical protein IJU91_03285 [Selenomonadaceae bacterium]|nr:hypothetical protein [Selenomonadaceae bacterium]